VDVRQNYARIGSAEIDKLYEEAVAIFDADRKIEIGNRIDRLVWEQVHSITFYQVPDIVAVKEKLANFGAFGFASTIYEDIGFKK
jgi:peptide/nickel transport system substrate-binding protein